MLWKTKRPWTVVWILAVLMIAAAGLVLFLRADKTDEFYWTRGTYRGARVIRTRCQEPRPSKKFSQQRVGGLTASHLAIFAATSSLGRPYRSRERRITASRRPAAMPWIGGRVRPRKGAIARPWSRSETRCQAPSKALGATPPGL